MAHSAARSKNSAPSPKNPSWISRLFAAIKKRASTLWKSIVNFFWPAKEQLSEESVSLAQDSKTAENRMSRLRAEKEPALPQIPDQQTASEPQQELAQEQAAHLEQEPVSQKAEEYTQETSETETRVHPQKIEEIRAPANEQLTEAEALLHKRTSEQTELSGTYPLGDVYAWGLSPDNVTHNQMSELEANTDKLPQSEEFSSQGQALSPTAKATLPLAPLTSVDAIPSLPSSAILFTPIPSISTPKSEASLEDRLTNIPEVLDKASKALTSVSSIVTSVSLEEQATAKETIEKLLKNEYLSLREIKAAAKIQLEQAASYNRNAELKELASSLQQSLDSLPEKANTANPISPSELKDRISFLKKDVLSLYKKIQELSPKQVETPQIQPSIVEDTQQATEARKLAEDTIKEAESYLDRYVGRLELDASMAIRRLIRNIQSAEAAQKITEDTQALEGYVKPIRELDSQFAPVRKQAEEAIAKINLLMQHSSDQTLTSLHQIRLTLENALKHLSLNPASLQEATSEIEKAVQTLQSNVAALSEEVVARELIADEPIEPIVNNEAQKAIQSLINQAEVYLQKSEQQYAGHHQAEISTLIQRINSGNEDANDDIETLQEKVRLLQKMKAEVNNLNQKANQIIAQADLLAQHRSSSTLTLLSTIKQKIQDTLTSCIYTGHNLNEAQKVIERQEQEVLSYQNNRTYTDNQEARKTLDDLKNSLSNQSDSNLKNAMEYELEIISSLLKNELIKTNELYSKLCTHEEQLKNYFKMPISRHKEVADALISCAHVIDDATNLIENPIHPQRLR